MSIKNQILNIRFKKNKFNKIGNNCEVGIRVSVENPQFMTIGDGLRLDEWCRLQTWPEYMGKPTGMKPELIIGNRVSFMRNCQVSCMNRIEIGDGCLFGDNVFITDNYHGDNSKEQMSIIPIERTLYSKGPVIIGKNVWVGRNVCIMPGVEIGDGAVIGANAVVTHSVNKGEVVAGVPAAVIK